MRYTKKKFKLAIIFLICGKKIPNYNQVFGDFVLFKYDLIAWTDT